MKYGITTLAALALLSLTTPLSAHHAFSAVFDDAHVVTVNGVLTRVEWVNPHVYFYVDGKAADKGTTEQHWAFESHPPVALRHAGLTREMLVVGQTVKIEAFAAKDGQPLAFAKSLQLPDGRIVRIMLDPKQTAAQP